MNERIIIDFHTHVLPGIDDGSKNTEMSLNMLRADEADVLVATPHFYGYREKLGRFLDERENAWKKLMQAKTGSVRMALGAEVAYFPGISRAGGLDELCIRGTNLLLLELPYEPWESAVIKEVEDICRQYELILAHLERYLDFGKNAQYVEQMQELPVHVQINAGSLCRLIPRFRVRKNIHADFLLGSDMHDLGRRAPNLTEGRSKLSEDRLKRIDHNGKVLLKGAVLK